MDNIPHFKELDFRLLFLDLDDVLNSVATCVAYGSYPWPNTVRENNHRDPNGYDPITGAWGTPVSLQTETKHELLDPPVTDPQAFNPVSVRLVRNLCENTDTHIVLSSTWRLGLDTEQIRVLLKYIGLNPERVIGRTCSGMAGWNRGMEIRDFLDRLLKDSVSLVTEGLLIKDLGGKILQPKAYVILDDSDSMLDSQEGNFVRVAYPDGLLLNDAVKAGRILVNPEFDAKDLHCQS